MEKISYENWLSSAQKWINIEKKVQDKEIFWGNGFYDLIVIEKCGYCLQFQTWQKLHRFLMIFLISTVRCGKCPLSKPGQQGISICSGRKSGFLSHFWLFVFEMRKAQPNFEIALQECTIVLNAILEDCPNRKQAIRDGIVFG